MTWAADDVRACAGDVARRARAGRVPGAAGGAGRRHLCARARLARGGVRAVGGAGRLRADAGHPVRGQGGAVARQRPARPHVQGEARTTCPNVSATIAARRQRANTCVLLPCGRRPRRVSRAPRRSCTETSPAPWRRASGAARPSRATWTRSAPLPRPQRRRSPRCHARRSAAPPSGPTARPPQGPAPPRHIGRRWLLCPTSHSSVTRQRRRDSSVPAAAAGQAPSAWLESPLAATDERCAGL